MNREKQTRPAKSKRPARPVLAASLALLVVLAFVSPANAAENLVLIPDVAFFGIFGGTGLGTMWVMLIGFVLLIFPLNALLFQPIFRALDARAERIAGARARSAQLQKEADEVLERYETAIRTARAEGEANRQVQLGGAREEQASLTAQARSEAEREIEQARSELARSLDDARATVRASAEDLAQSAAEQVLGRALS